MSSLIWTNHAAQRNKERKISESFINQTFESPDSSTKQEDQKTEYKKRIGNQTVTIITARNDRGEDLLLSAWIDPPNFGTADFKNEKRKEDMKEASFIKKLLLTFLNQIGI